MKHYDFMEWILYKNNVLPDKLHNEMEDHLYTCDLCMEIFLSLIEKKEIESTKDILSEDFNQKVLGKISKNKVKMIKNKKKDFNYYFGYYVAVAFVTVVLTFSGAYTNLVESVPKITNRLATVNINEKNYIKNFSDKIVNSTSSFIGSIENIEFNKEDK